ncbi:conserved hypothetical protein [Culex quinquefasciatus]|uniref:Serine/threonine-protein phosphatase 4 regulatory subunit 3-like central domain-containing protein n=1 Tax=Culex quinquefasciatus TaxID=7176 RepID=B0X6T4_CULQU|nr:conserved hypothetical protein [Culex quinquefasciatus]|eukprot:XP_001865356.1 conserved hypothetical protein [Culex quinquefasciatus]
MSSLLLAGYSTAIVSTFMLVLEEFTCIKTPTAHLLLNILTDKPASEVHVLGLVLMLLSFCIEHLTYHIKNCIINQNLLWRILVLIKSTLMFLDHRTQGRLLLVFVTISELEAVSRCNISASTPTRNHSFSANLFPSAGLFRSGRNLQYQHLSSTGQPTNAAYAIGHTNLGHPEVDIAEYARKHQTTFFSNPLCACNSNFEFSHLNFGRQQILQLSKVVVVNVAGSCWSSRPGVFAAPAWQIPSPSSAFEVCVCVRVRFFWTTWKKLPVRSESLCSSGIVANSVAIVLSWEEVDGRCVRKFVSRFRRKRVCECWCFFWTTWRKLPSGSSCRSGFVTDYVVCECANVGASSSQVGGSCRSSRPGVWDARANNNRGRFRGRRRVRVYSCVLVLLLIQLEEVADRRALEFEPSGSEYTKCDDISWNLTAACIILFCSWFSWRKLPVVASGSLGRSGSVRQIPSCACVRMLVLLLVQWEEVDGRCVRKFVSRFRLKLEEVAGRRVREFGTLEQTIIVADSAAVVVWRKLPIAAPWSSNRPGVKDAPAFNIRGRFRRRRLREYTKCDDISWNLTAACIILFCSWFSWRKLPVVASGSLGRSGSVRQIPSCACVRMLVLLLVQWEEVDGRCVRKFVSRFRRKRVCECWCFFWTTWRKLPSGSSCRSGFVTDYVVCECANVGASSSQVGGSCRSSRPGVWDARANNNRGRFRGRRRVRVYSCVLVLLLIQLEEVADRRALEFEPSGSEYTKCDDISWNLTAACIILFCTPMTTGAVPDHNCVVVCPTAKEKNKNRPSCSHGGQWNLSERNLNLPPTPLLDQIRKSLLKKQQDGCRGSDSIIDEQVLLHGQKASSQSTQSEFLNGIR